MIVFDVEGVILPKQRYLLQEMTLLNTFDQILMLLDGLLYEAGLRPLRETLERIYHRFEGVDFNDFANTFDEIALVPGVRQVIQELGREGYLIALISSGIPEPLLQKLAEKLKADYAIGPTLEVEEGKLTGRICGRIIEKEGKGEALSQVLEKANVSLSECTVVADDRNNLPMFHSGPVRIGFNPDFILVAHSDQVVKGDMEELSSVLLNGPHKIGFDGQEPTQIREIVHMGSFAMPLLCQYLGFERILLGILIVLVSLGFAVGELARIGGRDFLPFTTMTKLAATGPEHWDYATAPLYLALGVVLCLTVFPPSAGYVGITVVTLGDGVAKIVGKRWGKTTIPFNRPKKVEGTLSGLVASALVAMLYTSPVRALLAAAAGMLVEAIPGPVNDNLLISVVAGLVALIPI